MKIALLTALFAAGTLIAAPLSAQQPAPRPAMPAARGWQAVRPDRPARMHAGRFHASRAARLDVRRPMRMHATRLALRQHEARAAWRRHAARALVRPELRRGGWIPREARPARPAMRRLRLHRI